MKHRHKFYWTNTSIGGFASCTGEDWSREKYCGIIDTEVKESDCYNYVSPEQTAEIESMRREKRKKERETKRNATKEWIKNGRQKPAK